MHNNNNNNSFNNNDGGSGEASERTTTATISLGYGKTGKISRNECASKECEWMSGERARLASPREWKPSQRSNI